MALTHIRTATVSVSDQDAALDFYTNKLGFEKTSDEQFGPGMRWLEVRLPDTQTGIILAKGYGASGHNPVGKFTGLVLDADDIQTTYDTLRDRGVEFTEAPTQQPWGGIQAQFVDQDGNSYVLVQR